MATYVLSAPPVRALEADVRGVATLDCARKLRVHYLLPCAIDPELLARGIPGARCEIERFSSRAVGAKDHARVRLGTRVLASVVVGEPRVTVTYRKIEVARDHDGLEDDEAPATWHDVELPTLVAGVEQAIVAAVTGARWAARGAEPQTPDGAAA